MRVARVPGADKDIDLPIPHHDLVIVGSGFAGIGMASELRRAGRTDFVLLERSEALGGTWHANDYPGCACDVPSPYYSYSFAPNPYWSRFYAPHDEIQAYLEDCTDRFGVREHLRLNSELSGATWDSEQQRWTVDVNGTPAMTARVLVAAPGGLSRPAFPDLEGLGDFAGPWFHSAEWDHTVDLAGARIAVVGTGASAVQFVPRVAETAAHVAVFQRTAPWVLPKPDRAVPRLERTLYRCLPITQRAMRGLVWAMQEYMGLGNTVDRRITKPLELVGRAFIRRSISDPELRTRLTPTFAIGCKRVLLANDWYSTLDQPHVDVVSDRIARVTDDGLITADGATYPADVIIFGTGFKATDPFGDISIVGRDGRTLAEQWEGGIAAHRGTTIAGFPNLFLMPGPNTGTGHTSQVFMIEAQVRHILAALTRMDARGVTVIEPDAAAQEAFNARLQEKMQRTVWLRGGCTSWYLDEHGNNTTLWPYGSRRFAAELREIDDREFWYEPAPTLAPATVTTGELA